MNFKFDSDLHRRAFEACVTKSHGGLSGDAAGLLSARGLDYVLDNYPPSYVASLMRIAEEFAPILGTEALAEEIKGRLPAWAHKL